MDKIELIRCVEAVKLSALRLIEKLLIEEWKKAIKQK